MALTQPVPIRLFQLGVGLTAVLLGVLAALAPEVALALAGALLIVALVFADLAIGLAVFALVAFLEEFPAFSGVSFPKIVGLLLLLSWLGTVVVRRRGTAHAPLPPALLAAMLLLPAWAAISALWALDTPGVIDASQRWALNLTLIPITYAAIRRTAHLEWLFMVFVLGVILSAVLGMLGVFGGGGGSDLGDPVTRLGGAGINANELGGLLVCATAFAAALALSRRRSPAGRAIWLALSVLCAVGLASTLSRGAIVGMVVAFLCAPLVAGRGRRLPAALMSLLLAAAIALAVVALLPATAAQRLTASDLTGTGRTDIWRVGWRMVEDRPVLGVGAGNFDDTTVRYLVQPGAIQRDEFIIDTPKVAHNIYLHVLAELGAIGFVLFLAIVAACLGSALAAAGRFRQDGELDGEVLARALSIALIGLLAADFFSSQLYSKQLWLLLAAGPAILAVARRARA